MDPFKGTPSCCAPAPGDVVLPHCPSRILDFPLLLARLEIIILKPTLLNKAAPSPPYKGRFLHKIPDTASQGKVRSPWHPLHATCPWRGSQNSQSRNRAEHQTQGDLWSYSCLSNSCLQQLHPSALGIQMLRITWDSAHSRC